MFSAIGRVAFIGRLRGGLPGSVERSSEPQQIARLEASNLPPRGRAVYLEDAAGNVVWHRMVSSEHEADALIDLIRTQVLPARLVDFEAWLAGQRAEQG